ncbi:MAG: ribonuclease HIII [Methanosarcina sp.]|jgi:ribonuclease HIII|nr:ribonuclease HIII [Methanosarcina sp.]MDD4523959.1 ribonuclease HIII [Methanosarcina sp.]
MNEVLLIRKSDFSKLENFLKVENYDFESRPNAVFLAKKEGVTLTLYNSGKLLVTGRNSNSFISSFSKSGMFIPSLEKREEHIDTNTKFEPRIGTDESGKGDYFGYLAIGGVFVDSEDVQKKLIEIGVKDSKLLNDTTIMKLDKDIKKLCKTTNVSISPTKYNDLYTKLNNLNKLLAWGHARVIENLLIANNCEKVISDQFGDEMFIKDALMERGKKIELIQMPHAESDIAVAAASIIARAEFLRRLTSLSREYKIDFPKGASNKTVEVGKELVNKRGKTVLVKVAKIHFKTTNIIIGN